MKFIKNVVILITSLTAVLTVCQTANAGKTGLNVGNGRITPGLEKQYLQYQLQNNSEGLRQIRVIPGDCMGESGLRCNKTGPILEQIIRSNGGPTYQQMLMRAAGGEDNYRRFANFYNKGIEDGPYMSVWRNHSATILDAAQYSLGQTLDRNPVPELRNVTKNFFWNPLPGGNLRDDFVNFKLSYGRFLLQEISKIPNFKQEILQLPIGDEMKKFYETQVLNGLDALKTGNNEQLTQNIYSILSRPFNPSPNDNPWFGREAITIRPNEKSGEILAADVLADIPQVSGSELTEEVVELPGRELFFDSPTGASGLLPIGGGLLLALLLLGLLSGGSDSSDGSSTTSGILTPSPNPPSDVCDFVTPGGNHNGFCETPVLTPPPEPITVIEPSTIKAILVMALIVGLVRYRHRRTQAKF